MMKRIFLIAILSFIFVVNLAAMGYSGDNDRTAQKRYHKAKKKCLEQKWYEAIGLFQQLIEQFPDSRYQDDARFWLGYCFEKDEKTQLDAFLAYDELVKSYPASSWVDDAVVHQITIAEKFIKKGESQYLDFLVEQLLADDSVIRQHAALILGKLGDRRALPVLDELKNQEELSGIVLELIQRIESKNSNGTVDSESLSDLDIHRVEELKESGRREKRRDFLFIKSKRYKHYRSMLRKDGNWTKQELFDFGLWHIIKTNQFEEYYSLDGYDRQEWWRKFWKQQDPTPTTEKNQKLEEFIRRVNFAKANYSDLWPHERTKYLRDQHLIADWEHAPWDARGELYIKYGDPDFETFNGLYDVEWHYYGLGVDFVAHKFMTNIYGNAIGAGPVSRTTYKNLASNFEFTYIFQPQFAYYQDYLMDKIKKADLEIIPVETGKRNGQTSKMYLNYKIPVSQFAIRRKKNSYQISYLQRYVVFDEDMREILRKETTEKFTEETEDAFKKQKVIQQKIELMLNQGDYMVALRIEDTESNKVGIFVERFVVDNK